MAKTRPPAQRQGTQCQIPAAVTSGQQICLEGQGETVPGHRPGDLLITVSVAPHPFFKIDGGDLRAELPITLYEAVLGSKVRVPTLGGAVEWRSRKILRAAGSFASRARASRRGRGLRRSVCHDANRATRRERCRT